jgi:4-hydroxy-tetrahydrodipicolinate reductase
VHTKVHLRTLITNQIQIEAKRVLALFLGHIQHTFKRRQHRNQTHSTNPFGAVIAAEWIVGKQGVFTMKDVLELK